MIYYLDQNKNGVIIDHWLISLMTDERSARTIVKLLKEQYPRLYLIIVPERIYKKLPRDRTGFKTIAGVTFNAGVLK